MIKASLIIPTYNEAKNLFPLVEEIWKVIDKQRIDLEFIFVDDNSPDGTASVIEELKRKFPVKSINRPEKSGLGSAVRAGFMISDRDFLGVMDADLSHDPSVLNGMILALETCDLAIGSRFEKGSLIEENSLLRRSISRAGVFLTKILTGVNDPLSGYFFLARDVIKDVRLRTKGYKILFEILIKGKYKCVRQFSYTFRIRKFSTSKLDYKEYLMFSGQIIKYAFYKLFYKNGK